MTWAQRLKRVFNIDIETCRECGGAVRIIIACIEDPAVIEKILTHVKEKAAPEPVGLFCRKGERHRLSACNAQAGKHACTADARETCSSTHVAATLTQATGEGLAWRPGLARKRSWRRWIVWR